jgi:drug/metabolite transporter (DMT)-like permease
LSTITWGTGGLFVRLLPFDLGTIIFWRGLFGTAFVVAFLLFRFGSATFGMLRGIGGKGVFISLCSAATIILFTAGVQHTSVANAFTVLATLPFFSAAIAWLWIGERPSGLTIAASVIALVGILIMFRPTSGGPNIGDLLAVLGTVAQAVTTVAIRRSHHHVEMLPVACFAIFLSVLIAIPLAENLWGLGTQDYLIAAAFGLIAVALGMVLFMIGSAMIPATLSALIGTLEAPIGALWAWVGVGEVPATTTFIGGTIVFFSVFGRLLLEQLSARPPGRLSS